jgi:tetratricopeptide (TPR) repeat protein
MVRLVVQCFLPLAMIVRSTTTAASLSPSSSARFDRAALLEHLRSEAVGADMAEHEETAEPSVGEPLSGADPAAVTIALGRAGRSSEVNAKAAIFLDEQTSMLRLQMEHLHEERALHHRHLALKYFGDRLRIGLQLLAIAFGLTLAIGLAAFVWSAHEDHGLVVEAFSVPPDLAQRGLTGQVVAKQVLDRLSDLQAQTESMRPAETYQNNWGDDLKVEIPETGISLGELRRYLTGWLGHQTHISGEVYRTSSGLTVTARAGETAGKSFSGADGDFDKLVQQAAEAVYERTQPYRYTAYLQDHGRIPEGLAILQRLARGPDPMERAWAHRAIGISRAEQGFDLAGDSSEQRAALRAIPEFAPALSELAFTEAVQGHDREAARVAAEYLSAEASGRLIIPPGLRSSDRASVIMIKYEVEGDYDGEVRKARAFLRSGQGTLPTRGDLANALLVSHDLAGARAAAARLPADDPDRFNVPGRAALELGDPGAVGLLTQAGDIVARDIAQRSKAIGDWSIWLDRGRASWFAIAQARFGDPAVAQSAMAGCPVDSYPCVRARGVIAASLADRAGAERWFAEAIRQAPDLPQAFVERGRARLAWGDVAGAITDAQRANKASPRNADALKLWGDGLARQGRWDDAVGKFGEALKYAGAWKELHQARDSAAKRAG